MLVAQSPTSYSPDMERRGSTIVESDVAATVNAGRRRIEATKRERTISMTIHNATARVVMPHGDRTADVDDGIAAGNLGANPFQTYWRPFVTNRQERRAWASKTGKFPESAVTLNKWRGVVTGVAAETFSAMLYDMNKSDVVETADFEISSVDRDDIELVKPGASFYWYIIRHETSAGKRMTLSQFWFRRAGRVTDDAFSQALQKMKSIWKSFGWPASDK